ncbi:UNVERIFIED_CONTAM: hypothetical protein FKN15_064606 [Acipenser sinensis]
MTSAVISSVPTTASRFALLQVDSDSESDSEPGKGKGGRDAGKSRTGKASGSKSNNNNEKKKEKRKKKKEQQQSEANELTSELYETDLEKALILSKLEYEEHKKELKPVNAPTLDDRFFNKLEDDVSKILLNEKRREQTSFSGIENCASSDQEPDVRTEQLKYELEKKDLEIEKLKKVISQWESKYKEVKARNSQLLKMLQLGERDDWIIDCQSPLATWYKREQRSVECGEWRVESGEWRVESGEWRVESGEWRVESGEWRVESGEWRVESGEWRVESGEWRVESGEWRVESGEWRVESGEWRVESGEWRVKSEE